MNSKKGQGYPLPHPHGPRFQVFYPPRLPIMFPRPRFPPPVPQLYPPSYYRPPPPPPLWSNSHYHPPCCAPHLNHTNYHQPPHLPSCRPCIPTTETVVNNKPTTASPSCTTSTTKSTKSTNKKLECSRILQVTTESVQDERVFIFTYKGKEKATSSVAAPKKPSARQEGPEESALRRSKRIKGK